MTAIVRVKVEEIKPSGVFVEIIYDDRKGFIHKKELSWDRRVWAEPEMPEVGEEFEAKIIRDGKQRVLLSLRELDDPWIRVGSRYEVGQPVWGEVVHIRRFGVFVQLKPGIDAVIWRQNLPLLVDQHPKDMLSIGDQVMGVVTELDLQQQQISISLLEWLETLSRISLKKRRSIQEVLFSDTQARRQEDRVLQRRHVHKDSEERHRYHPPIPHPQRILVIDDEPHDLDAICTTLEETFDIPIDGVTSGEAARIKIEDDRFYGVAVIDLDLSREKGSEVAEELSFKVPDLAFVFTSNNPRGEDRLSEDYVQRYPFVLKDSQGVTQAVENLLSGYWEEIETENETGNFIRHLGMEAFAQRSIEEILRNMLETLRQEVHTTHAFVLEVDFTKKSVSILASDPPLEPTVHARSVDNLYYSPARSVVEDEDEFYDSYIDSNKELRYKYFFPLLAYRSCFGLPLQVPDIRTRHALFLLDEQNVGFTFEERERIRTVALAMRSALERGLLLDYMRRYEQRYTLGQLLGSLVHELSNEVGILQRNIGFLSTTMDKIRNRQSEDQSVTLDEVYTQLGELKASQESLAGLLKAYSRVAKGDAEAVDVNSVARRVKKSVDKAAEESRVVIYLDLEDGLPRVRSITSRLEQVMTNLVLNAIQQIYRQKLFMKHLAQGKGSQSPILQRGQVIIQTRYVREGPRPVNIFVMDTGPGIHYHHQQHLFQMDVSTREGGHGLGLFISRNLVESMGGRLRLVDSLMFIGSLFVIEVPLYHQTKE